MGNNNLKTTNDVLVKVDQNNLIYIDPNSVLVNGKVEPRAIEPENLMIYVNLEADMVPRSVLVMNNEKNSLLSIAKGTLNFLQKKDGRDYDTSWTNAYTDVKATSGEDTRLLYDDTAQSFGIDSISIQVKGANFIPRVLIKFIDVRGKTLFESPENSPYGAFFHIPWPIFYLTVKGYYGKAIRYRLHMIKFNSRFNSNNGNFEIECNFVGSTYAYLADITLEAVLNAPYFYASQDSEPATYNEKTKYYDKKVKKSSKGYRVLKSVYQDYINQGLLEKGFPVKTLREIIVIAGRLNQMLEKEIFPNIIDHHVLAAVKEYEDTITQFESAIENWKGKYLTIYNIGYSKTRIDPINKQEEVVEYKQRSEGKDKNTLVNITGSTDSLQAKINFYIGKLEQNEAFGIKATSKKRKPDEIVTKSISCSGLKDFSKFYIIRDGKVGVDIDGVFDEIYVIERAFIEQRNALEIALEQKMNEYVKNPDFGFGFEPKVRNIIGVLLANAETFIRLMKDVHYKAFEQAENRKQYLAGVDTDSPKTEGAIYPWPEVKALVSGGKELVLMYPGSLEMVGKLRSDSSTLWPEVDFVENFYDIGTKRTDKLSGDEGNVNYIFDPASSDMSKKDISVLSNIMDVIPYTNKSFSSILYEIYERSKYTTSLSPFSNAVISEIVDVEFNNLKEQLTEDVDIIDMLKSNVKKYVGTSGDTQTLLSCMESTSTYERYPYYVDQLPTVPYIQEGLSNDFLVEKYVADPTNITSYNNEYVKLSEFLSNYKTDGYRRFLYPFNSAAYQSYLGDNDTILKPSRLQLNGILQLNTPDDFISSPRIPQMWVKDGFSNNLFTNTIKINGVDKHILNTPYFHNQLFSDFSKISPRERYVGSSYLLLSSLPFKDLDEEINNIGLQSSYAALGLNVGREGTLMSTIFREVGASHFIPYHMMLKWGSIYHRYKKWINEGVDIIANVTDHINGAVFYDGGLGTTTYTVPGGIDINRSTEDDIGFHPYYETIFHQIVNGYGFYDVSSGDTSYEDMIASGVTKIYHKNASGARIWTSFIDNERFGSSYTGYTLLPCNGYNEKLDASNFTLAEQENFRILWNVGVTNKTPFEYSGYTFPSYNEYFKLTGSTGDYSLETNYRKVIDLIATFKPAILDTFESAFLNFASEKLNEEIPYSPYNVDYSKFQDLLQKIVSIKHDNNDPTDEIGFLTKIKQRQSTGLIDLTDDILSLDNLIRLSLANPRENDDYVLGGFTNVDVEHFSVDSYNASQLTSDNLDYIELYLGEDMDGYYQDFFSSNNIELNEYNILQFRSLIYLYAGLRRAGNLPSGYIKPDFVNFLKTNLIYFTTNSQGVSNPIDRLSLFLTQFIGKIQSDLKSTPDNGTTGIKRGYNDDGIKLELYNYFKSFNDKWSAGNSIGQRSLMGEFLFLDKANKDIGDLVYLDMEKLLRLKEPGNEGINLYSAISLLVQDTGFDIRALPAYINFYGTSFGTTSRITPSKTVARNMFGTFLDVDIQDSTPKIILQYIGPTSKHLEMSDINGKYRYKNDGFDIGNPNKNPIIVAPDVFTKTDFSKSNKVVAFEVSFGDQNQSIFKGIELDQSSIKNTSESFEVIERLGRSETGASTAQVDIGLWDIYKQSSYQCQVSCMGNMMIQPTMYFYLKNVPLFRGSYWITEVTHDIRTNRVETSFKGTRIPSQSLPDPSDSFLASYRSLFDKLVKKAGIKVKEDEEAAKTKGKEKSVTTSTGTATTDPGIKTIPNEKLVLYPGTTPYGIHHDGQGDDKYTQLVKYNGEEWLRTYVVTIGGIRYKPDYESDMTLISNNTSYPKVKYKDIIKSTNSTYYYFARFDSKVADSDTILNAYGRTEFINPTPYKDKDGKMKVNRLMFNTDIDYPTERYDGPISVGPNLTGYGIALSEGLMKKLGLKDGDLLYFRLSPTPTP